MALLLTHHDVFSGKARAKPHGDSLSTNLPFRSSIRIGASGQPACVLLTSFFPPCGLQQIASEGSSVPYSATVTPARETRRLESALRATTGGKW
jgi:hypothetical protein